MTQIIDPLFIRKIYRDFCCHDLRGGDGRLFLSRCVIEIDLPHLAIVEYENGEPFTPVSFALHSVRGVDSVRYHPWNRAIADCVKDPDLNKTVDAVLRRFLRRHNLQPTSQRRTA